MRSNHPEKTQRIIPQDPLWDILFLRLEGTHLSTESTVFYSGHDPLLRIQGKLFNTTRARRGLLEIFKRLSVEVNLLCQLVSDCSDPGNFCVVFVFYYCVYYESIKQKINKRLIYECRCDERLKVTGEGSTRLGYTGWCGGLEYLKI